MKKVNLVIGVSVALNLILGLAVARFSGESRGLHELNRIYVGVACANVDDFMSRLESYDLSQVSKELTETDRRQWIEGQLSRCFSPGSAEAATQLAVVALSEQFGTAKEKYYSYPVLSGETAKLTVVFDVVSCEVELTKDQAKPPYGWLLLNQKCFTE